jgi:hypothetical protein
MIEDQGDRKELVLLLEKEERINSVREIVGNGRKKFR